METSHAEFWRVLLVDDDEEDYLLTRWMLAKTEGKKVILEWVTSYPEAVEKLAAADYDAVLVDYDLGISNGIDLIRETVTRGYSVPLILYSGRGTYETDIEAMQAGAALFLTKTEANPFLLERAIRYAIERKQAEKALIESENLFQTAVENLLDAFAIFSALREEKGEIVDFRVEYVNEAACVLSRRAREEFMGRRVLELYPELPRTGIFDLFLQAVEQGGTIIKERLAFDSRLLGQEGIRYIDIRLTKLGDGFTSTWRDVTAQVRAEEVLRISEERFSKAFNATPSALVISRLADGLIEMVNDSFVRLFGYSRAEVIGKTSLQLNMFAHPSDRDQLVRRLQADQSLHNVEIEVRTASGEIRRANLSVETLTIGSEPYVLTVVEDITERKRTEETLRENEEVLRLALAAGQAGAWSWDLNTDTLYWSDDYYRTFGYEPGSIRPSAEAGFRHVHPDDLPEIQAVLRAAIERGRQIDLVHRVIWPDGSIHWIRGISQAFYDEQGKPCRMAGIAIDITAQKQAEMELEAAHRETSEILESISDAFYSLDGEGRFTYVNQKAASLWGKQPAELLGNNIWEVFPSGKATESYRVIQQALADRRPVQYESYSEFLDQWVDIHIYPARQGISVYFQDITERKKAESVVQVYTKELERSNRDLQEFAFVASHDLQEPLRKIEAFGDLILAGAGNLTELQKDQFGRMRKAAERMRSMVNGLLQLSRLATQAQPFQPVDLCQVAQEVVSDLEVQINRTGGVVEVGDLPVLEADTLQMRQLLQNLIGNALKFQPPGGKPRVKVYSRRPTAGTVQILVQDNGIGFEQDRAGLVFQPFRRLVGKTEFEGSGIGLAISRRIVERHGGEISARSRPGHGATFMITLPIKQNGSRN